MAQSDPSSDDASAGLALNIDVESIPDAVLVANSDTGQIVKANTTAGELFGCHPAALIGRHQQELHPSDNQKEYTEAFQRAIDSDRVNRLQNGQPVYIERLDGQRIPVEINAQALNTSDGVFILGVFREVTEQLDREQRLAATSGRLGALLDALPVPVAVLDTDTTIERWNQAAERTFGYGAESVIGEPYPLFIEDDEFEQLTEQIFDHGILDGYETTHRAQDGSRVPVELYARPLYRNNTVTGIIGASVDLTNRQQREQQLDVLHRVMRHNLRNELTVINGWTQHLADGTDEQHKAVEKIEGASDRLLELSEEAKRIRTGLSGDSRRPDSIPITDAVAHLSEHVAAQKNTAMSVIENPETGAICRRGLRAISQLLDNVLANIDGTDLELAIETNDQYISFELAAPLPVLPVGARSFITSGEETPLEHGRGLGVVKSYLMVESLGGTVIIDKDNETGPDNTLIVELPRMDI